MTNCNHKHGLMLACRHDVDMFTWGRIVLFLPKRAHVDWNWPISREKSSKNRLVYKNAVALAPVCWCCYCFFYYMMMEN